MLCGRAFYTPICIDLLLLLVDSLEGCAKKNGCPPRESRLKSNEHLFGKKNVDAFFAKWRENHGLERENGLQIKLSKDFLGSRRKSRLIARRHEYE